MKVKELIEQLKKIDPEREVVLSADGEGNSYSPLEDIWEKNCCFVEEDRETHFEELTEELKKDGYSEEDIYDGDKSVPAIVLYP